MQCSSFDEIVLVSTLLNSIVEASQSFFFFYCMCGKRQCPAASPLFLGSTVLRWMERNEVTHGMPMSFASVVPSLLSLVGPLLLSFLTSAFFWWKFFLLFLVVDEIGLHFFKEAQEEEPFILGKHLSLLFGRLFSSYCSNLPTTSTIVELTPLLRKDKCGEIRMKSMFRYKMISFTWQC